jgi:acetyl-CoA acetyltransferase
LRTKPHRLILLSVRVPTRRRLTGRSLSRHHSILASKVWSLQRTQGGSLCSRKYSTPFRIGAHDVDDVVVGKNSNDGDHSACIGRLSVLPAGWPVEAPGSTINGFCGSGEQAIALGAMGIRAGYQDLVVAGGLESMPRITFDVKSGSPEAGNRALLDRYR